MSFSLHVIQLHQIHGSIWGSSSVRTFSFFVPKFSHFIQLEHIHASIGGSFMTVFFEFHSPPNCNNFTVPFGIHGCLLFSPISPFGPIATISWIRYTSSIDDFFLFFFFHSRFHPLATISMGNCGRKRTKVDITDQIRLFYDEIWTPLAMRTVLTCSHEDQTTVFAFTYSCYDYYSSPILTVTSTQEIYATVVLDCRLDQCPGVFSFSNFLMLDQKWRSATRGF